MRNFSYFLCLIILFLLTKSIGNFVIFSGFHISKGKTKPYKEDFAVRPLSLVVCHDNLFREHVTVMS